MGTLRRAAGFVGPVLVTLALLGAVEGGLRVAGFSAPIAMGGDPVANLIPLFHPATAPDGTPVWRRTDAPVTFRRDKPPNGLRVFVLGESPVFGWPFGVEFGFPRFLEDRLAAAFPDRVVEVVNCGLNGNGSWHTRRILEEEVVRYAPDVVIIYAGHGDWLTPTPVEVSPLLRRVAYLRLVQLAAVTSARWRQWRYGQFDAARLKAVKDPFGYGRQRARGELTLSRAEADAIVRRFTANMNAMVRVAKRAGARVVLATVAQNLRDFPPGSSRHRRGLSPSARARWAVLTDRADDRAAAGNYEGALAALDEALRIDRRPALSYYQRARCEEGLGHWGRARAGYRIASDRDEVPMGARSVTNDAIRAVARETGAQLVDVAGALAEANAHGFVGDALFFDHTHPTFRGRIAIARVFATALGAPGGTWPDPAVLEAEHPELMRQAHAARVLVFIMLGWYDLAEREVDDGIRPFLDVAKASAEVANLRAGIATLRRADPSRARTDLPEADE